MKRFVAALVFTGLAFALSQCSSKSSTSQREPLVHLDSPEVCELADAGPLGPDCSDATQPGCACSPTAANNQCTAGPHGLCAYHGWPGHWCEYDLCVTANDCASGSTCLCGNVIAPYAATSRCVPSNCHVDADCGSRGYCSPSVEQPTGYCGGGPSYGGAYCHTEQDDCTDDSDCDATKLMKCAYDVEQSKWTCQEFDCAAG